MPAARRQPRPHAPRGARSSCGVIATVILMRRSYAHPAARSTPRCQLRGAIVDMRRMSAVDFALLAVSLLASRLSLSSALPPPASRLPRPRFSLPSRSATLSRMATQRTLRGASVIVTGASSGIGREAALAFARRGANVARGRAPRGPPAHLGRRDRCHRHPRPRRPRRRLAHRRHRAHGAGHARRLRPHRCAREQRRLRLQRHHRADERGRHARDARRQLHGRVQRHPRRPAAHARAARRPHRQRRLGRRQDRLPLPRRLLGDEVRHDRA